MFDIEVGIISRVSDKHLLGFDKDHNEAVGAEVSERQLLLLGDCRLTPQM